MNWRGRNGSLGRAVWIAGIALVATGLGLMVQGLFDISFTAVGVAVAAIVGAAGFVAPVQNGSGAGRFLPPLLLLPAALFGFWYFITVKFGSFGLGPILFHMDYGVEADGLVAEFIGEALLQLSSVAALLAGLWLVTATDHRFRHADRFAVLPLLALNPVTFAAFEYVGDAQAADERLLALRYVETADLQQTRQTPPNLIQIFLESSERTLSHREDFGDVMDPLIPFARRGLELTGIDQAALTSWSLAGDVASHCGVPLKPLGLVTHNSYHVLDDAIMPNAQCLGNLLSRDGYSTSVMHTSPLQFAGADKLFGAHGWAHLIGFQELRRHYPVGGNAWGVDDEDLYDAVYHRVVQKTEAGERFAIVVANVGGHAPRGYVSRSCHGRPSVDRIADPTLKAFRCTHELAAEMLNRLDAGGYLGNTVVVVQSDHLAMRNTIYNRLKRHERRNLFFAFGPGIEPQVIDRDMTMMDVYPTLLDLLGYAPRDGRAGVGVSAFAAGRTLIEERGLEALDDAIYADVELRNRLWGVTPGI